MIKDNFSEKEVKQEIDLEKVFKRKVTRAEAIEFGERALDRMIERTQDGKKRATVNSRKEQGGNFKQYSKDYAKFKGVNRADVDLTFLGDMLLSAQTEFEKGVLSIFIDGDDELNTKKAYNHHVGDTLPARPFFGINKKEAKRIAEEIKSAEPDVPSVDSLSIAQIFKTRQDSESRGVSSILDSIGITIVSEPE